MTYVIKITKLSKPEENARYGMNEVYVQEFEEIDLQRVVRFLNGDTSAAFPPVFGFGGLGGVVGTAKKDTAPCVSDPNDTCECGFCTERRDKAQAPGTC